MSKDVKARYLDIASQYSLPVFFQPWWMDMVSKRWDIALLEDDKGLQAIWPYTIEKKFGLSLIRNPLLTPYLGPLFFFPPGLSEGKRIQKEEKLIPALLDQFPKWDFMDVMCMPSFTNFPPLHHLGFENTQRITYHIDLSLDEDILWEHVHSKQKYAIRQAEKELKIEDGQSHIEQFYQLHRSTLESKKQKYPYSEAFFKNIIETAAANKASFFKAAVNANGELAALLFTVFDKDSSYLLLTATNKDAKHNGAVAWLIWQAVLHAKNNGLKLFDFEGSMNKGIEQFFRSFGGDRKTYLQATSHRSKIWKLREFLR